MHMTLIAVACSALLSIGTASAVTSEPADTVRLPAAQIAKKGADDPAPAPDCDDHGTDICLSVDRIARKGADDPAPAPDCDDHGSDVCFTRA